MKKRNRCDAEITEQEIFDTITRKLLKNNKSPGDDGIVSEFYKEYWYLIREKFRGFKVHFQCTYTFQKSIQRRTYSII